MDIEDWGLLPGDWIYSSLECNLMVGDIGQMMPGTRLYHPKLSKDNIRIVLKTRRRHKD
jgi:hypothetical protein